MQSDDLPLCRLAWSPDAGTLAGYSSTGEIRLLDSDIGKAIKSINERMRTPWPQIVWLPNSDTGIISISEPERGLRLWDLRKGTPMSEPLRYERNSANFRPAISADERTLVLAASGSVGMFDLSTRTLVKEITESSWAHSAAWSPDARELAVTSDSGTTVWSNSKHRGLVMLPTENWDGAHWLPTGDVILSTVGSDANLFSRRAQRWEKKYMPIKIGGYGGDDPARLSPDGKLIAL